MRSSRRKASSYTVQTLVIHRSTISETAAKFLNLVEENYGYIAAICVRHLDGIDAEAYGPFKTEKLAQNYIGRLARKLEDDTTTCGTTIFDAREASPPPNSKVRLQYGIDDEGVPSIGTAGDREFDDENLDSYEEEVLVRIPGEADPGTTEIDKKHDYEGWKLLLRKLRERFRLVSEDDNSVKALTSPFAISRDGMTLYVRDTSPFFKRLADIGISIRWVTKQGSRIKTSKSMEELSTELGSLDDEVLGREADITWWLLTPNKREGVIQAFRSGGFDFKV